MGCRRFGPTLGVAEQYEGHGVGASRGQGLFGALSKRALRRVCAQNSRALTQRWLQFALAGIVFIFTPSLAHAESPVLILVSSGDDPNYAIFENRLRSELLAAGFSVETASVSEPLNSVGLAMNAVRYSASRAISITISNEMVFGLVYIANSGNGPALIRAVPGYPVGEQAPSVFAVKATDVLHGALLELAHSANASSATVPKMRRAQRNHHRARHRLRPKFNLQHRRTGCARTL